MFLVVQGGFKRLPDGIVEGAKALLYKYVHTYENSSCVSQVGDVRSEIFWGSLSSHFSF